LRLILFWLIFLEVFLLQIGQFPSRCVYVNNVLIKPYLHNNITTAADYYYNYSTKPYSAIIRLTKRWR